MEQERGIGKKFRYYTNESFQDMDLPLLRAEAIAYMKIRENGHLKSRPIRRAACITGPN